MSVLKNLSVTPILPIVFVFCAVCVLNLVSAQNDLELSPRSDLEEIEELLRNVQLIFETKIASRERDGTLSEEVEEDDVGNDVDPNGCNCSGMKCSCCTRIRIKVFKIKANCCLSVTYLPSKEGILVSLTIGSKSIFSKEISVKKPPRLCVGVPFWKKGASICIEFYDLRVDKKSLSGCSRARVTLVHAKIAKFKLGCFRIKFITNNNTQQVDEVDLPYLDVSQALVEDPKAIYYGEVEMEKIRPALFKKNK